MGYWVIGIILGQLSVQLFAALPSLWMVVFVWILLLLVWRVCPWRGFLCACLLGFTWTYGHATWQLSLQIPVDLEGETLQISGEIIAAPHIHAHSTRFLFQPDSHRFGIIQVDWYQTAPALKQGQRWQLPLRLKRPRNYANPGGFDYARYLFLNKITATGYVYERAGPKLLQDNDATIGLRQQIAGHIDTALQQRPFAALIKGLAVGLRDTMTDDQWMILQKTGTSHLLAISGLHVGLVSGLVFFLIRRLWALLPRLPLYIPAPHVAAWAAILAAAIYSALAGFALPTQRALIMITVAMLCICTRHHFKALDILGFAALVIIMFDPFASMSASFWLSFLAVGLLLLASYQQTQKWRAGLQIQWAISLGLTPLVIAYFHQIAWLSPLANFIAIPWASFTVVPLTLLGVVASFIDLRLATFFWLLAETALQHLWWFLQLLADQPWAWQEWVINDTRVWLTLGLGSILLLLPRALPGRSLGFLLLAAVFFVRTPKPAMGEVWFTLLDVGQGLAVVVQTKNHALIFDTGMRFDQFDLGEAVVMPFLKHQGIKHIDTLVLSHNHLDHTGGAPYLMEHMKIMRLLSGEAITDLANVQERCLAGERWQWDEVTFEFLYPSKYSKGDSNDTSCVLKITAGEYSALLTGDIEKHAEKWLVAQQADLSTTILVAPHHGSRTSSSKDFVELTTPDYVLFATGYRNRYDFPRTEVVERYIAQGAKIYDTAKTGAIQFKFSKEGVMLPSLYRQTHPKWWEEARHDNF